MSELTIKYRILNSLYYISGQNWLESRTHTKLKIVFHPESRIIEHNVTDIVRNISTALLFHLSITHTYERYKHLVHFCTVVIALVNGQGNAFSSSAPTGLTHPFASGPRLLEDCLWSFCNQVCNNICEATLPWSTTPFLLFSCITTWRNSLNSPWISP